jgi:hypothetical protein
MITGVSGARGATQAPAGQVATFTGYGFDTCGAPSLATLSAWLTSPYRAIGIYIGGTNRACPDGNLSASWVTSALNGGWSLIPLYVGLQAPCVSQANLALIDPASAATQGTAAADDAAAKAVFFGLPAGSPIYFDMEGYKTNDTACTRAVQAFLSAWDSQLHARGLLAGVYGSAASTIRDLLPLAGGPPAAAPDQVWIANWNGQASVFGDPYVPDSVWTNHQRLHQFKGGHHETYGGVTVNIDNDYLDGAVVGPAAAAPPPVPPPPPTAFQAGSVGSGDGKALASWPTGAFTQPVVVTLMPSTLAQAASGFAAGSYLVRLSVTQTSGGAAVTKFALPVVIHVSPPTTGLVPAYSADGTAWSPLPQVPASGMPAKTPAGYSLQADGSLDIKTTTAGLFGLLRDISPPTPATGIRGRFSHGSLVLAWQPATDNTGAVPHYEIAFDGQPLLSVTKTTASVRTFNPGKPSAYTVIAIDASGNQGAPSSPLVVAPAERPVGLPRPLPGWAWPMLDWLQSGRAGARPAAPQPLPGWFWTWAHWRLEPFRIVG